MERWILGMTVAWMCSAAGLAMAGEPGAAGEMLLAGQPLPASETLPANEATVLEVDLGMELPLVALGALAWLTPMLLEDELQLGDPTQPLDRNRVNALDRFAMGDPTPAARTASDVIGGIVPAGVLAATLVTEWDQGWGVMLEDLVIVSEATVLTGLVNQVTRHAFRRQRPYMYSDAGESSRRNNAEDEVSFFSGHTSITFAAVVSFSLLNSYRHPESQWNWVPWAAGLGLGTAMATCRVVAQDHFVTDVVVGAAVGTAFGLLVPWLHKRSGATGTATLVPEVSTDYVGLTYYF